MKRYIGFARVSSREQEREGFSLDVQEEAFEFYAKRENGVVDKVFRIAETATKNDQRKIFREAITFAKRNAAEYDGILFYKIDRAARNMKDLMLLEEIEKDYDLPFISVTQPVENTPTGRMIRRTLATIGAFQTEQMSLDIRSGIAKRVAIGWFPSRCPYGYRNIRTNGRATAEVHRENAPKVQRAFELRAYEGLLVEQIAERLYMEGLFYTPSKPRFPETKLYAILHDLSYNGFVKYQGQWHPGLHETLIDKMTWDLVRVSFDEQKYRSHEMVYANQLIHCGYCGHPITGEEKEKVTKAGPMKYIYYRCGRYQRHGHPRVRLREQELDLQVRQMLADFRAERPELQRLIFNTALSRLEDERTSSEVRAEEVKRQLSLIEGQRDELLNLRLAKGIPEDRFAAKQAELQEREDLIRRQVQLMDELRNQNDALAARAPDVFVLIQQDWDTLSRMAKHDILRLLFGGFVLDDRTLVPRNGTPLELFRAG
jgi:site-specific DNA recombinase